LSDIAQCTWSLSSIVSHFPMIPSPTDLLQFYVPTVLCSASWSVFYNFSSSVLWGAPPHHPVQVEDLLAIQLNARPLFCFLLTSCSPSIYDHTKISSGHSLKSGILRKCYLALLLPSIRKT
jgi:hypothetical protein